MDTTPKSEPPPPGIHPIKPIFFSNGGILKRHAPLGGAYKECLKNHAATKGGHALDGCGEFLPAPSASPADPTSLTCAACGCHRNFHRRDPEDSSPPLIEYRPHHRHHPPPPPSLTARASQSPPPISSSYYPHMLLALSEPNRVDSNPNRKRFRTKFTQNQKDKMQELAEKLGWKMQKINDDLVNKVCSEIGVERGVFKVWMHNNKNTLAKRTVSFTGIERNGNGNGDGNSHSHSSSIEQQDHHHHLHNAAAIASSSSS